MFTILGFFWIIRETKQLLFYIYLWQLKEYHFGRFKAHFQTFKGRKLLWNKNISLKIILLFVFVIFLILSYTGSIDLNSIYTQIVVIPLLFLYFLESALFIYNVFQKKIKTPTLTQKTTFLISLSFLLEFLFLVIAFAEIKNLFWFAFAILLFDILSPVIFSILILAFQPFTVLIRNQIIKKASQKINQHKKLLKIGITGSYGKTSTKEILAEILSEKFTVLKTKENQNSEIGISQCILNELQPKHEVFVCEMGAYKRGGIKLLADIIKPKLGILTGINEQHLATFGSRENIVNTKYELIAALPERGLAVFNANNDYCYKLYQKTKKPKRISYIGLSQAVRETMNPDIWAEDVKVDKQFLYFKAVSRGPSSGKLGRHRASTKLQSAEFRVNLIGERNIENILMAVLAARELGMSLSEIASACRKIVPEQGNSQIKKSKQGFNIIDSTYSANPDGVIADLEHLKNWEGKKAIVMPCLIELGEAGSEVHKRIGKRIGQICDLAIITTRDYFQEIKNGAVGTKIGEKNIVFTEDAEEIFGKIKELTRSEDIVLLESRVPREIIGLLEI